MGGQRLAALCGVAMLWATPAGAAHLYEVVVRGTITSAFETNGSLGSLGVGSVITARAIGGLDPYLTNVAGSGDDLMQVSVQFSGGDVNWTSMSPPYAGLYPWGHIEPMGTYGPIIEFDGPQMIFRGGRLVDFSATYTAEPGPDTVALYSSTSYNHYTEIHDEVDPGVVYMNYQPSAFTPNFTIYNADGTQNYSYDVPVIEYYGQWDYAGAEVFIDGVKVGSAPEPSSWMLAIAGFGLTGAALRRRSKLIKPVAAA